MSNDHFKEKLLSEKEILIKDLEKIAVLNTDSGIWEPVPETQNGPEADMNDLADRLEDYEERNAMVKVFAHRLDEVLHALEKFDLGTYGICEVSGEHIETERLEANPAARTNKEHILN